VACSVSGTLQECYRRHTYCANGELKTLQDANGNTTTYAYDGWRRLVQTIFPDSTISNPDYEQLTLDEDSNVTARRNRANETLNYTYNALDWVTQKASPNPAVTDYWTYLLDGRIDTLCDVSACGTPGNIIDYGYDTAGRLNQVANRINGFGANRTVNYTLDANGNRTKLAWPSQDAAYYVGYCYDALNRLTAAMENSTSSGCATSLLATYAYDPLSRRTAVTYGNGASMSYPSYSNAGDLLALNHDMSGSADDPHFSFAYTNAHQLQTDTVSDSDYAWQPGLNGTDSYAAANALNQYPSITPGGGSVRALGYDLKGNLTSGNLTGAGAWTFAYDAENRLLTADKTSGGTVHATYAYDPLGRRTKKSGTGVTTTYFLNDGTDEIAEYDNTKTVTNRYIPGPAIDEPIAVENASTGAHEYFQTNRQGSVIAMSDDTGAKAEGPYVYDPYGNCFSGGSACSNSGEPYRFTGRRLDPETGLLYYRARYYWPQGGRFLQVDPVGYIADMNLYAYVGNEPTNRADPIGLCPPAVCKGGDFEIEGCNAANGPCPMQKDQDKKQDKPAKPPKPQTKPPRPPSPDQSSSSQANKNDRNRSKEMTNKPSRQQMKSDFVNFRGSATRAWFAPLRLTDDPYTIGDALIGFEGSSTGQYFGDLPPPSQGSIDFRQYEHDVGFDPFSGFNGKATQGENALYKDAGY